MNLSSYLDKIAARYREGYLETDPIGIVRQLKGKENLEIGALFASVLSLGRVAAIRARTLELFDRMDGEPFRFVLQNRHGALKGFRHRFFSGDDFAALSKKLRAILTKNDSLGGSWRSDLPFEDALTRFSESLSTGRTGIPLVASPENGSTCKRILMYLRWMARPSDGIDLGLWNTVKPSELIIPMDTHVFKISRLLGLTDAKTPSWKAAVGVTGRLLAFDPGDPTRFDFALSRIGIVQGCKARYVPAICTTCPMFTVCSAAKA